MKQSTSIQIEKETHAALVAEKEKSGRSIAWIVQEAIKQFLSKK